ncbi:Zinc ion binding nucleic acid binding protein [Quillaja saponaria]|uniref:Zinc ion binding nucleic acid binding protein n=1 Tax=Quillaja saponaria TaxID=32244 RepID=A0AAD7LQK6_QUISA|nr:Zinc ion binding nucleic acid binding protein [Quillaja saponaria]
MGICLMSLRKKWQLKGDLKLIDLGCDFYIVHLNSSEDLNHMLTNGPWIIVGHYLTMRRWKPEFQPNKERIKHIAVWIQFPELPIEYFQSDFLFEAGGQIGKILKVDKATQDSERGKFARICIEIELDKPLIPKIKIGKKWRRIEYKGYHMICFHCGVFGHSKEHCPTNVKVNNEGKRDSNVPDGPCDMASERMPDDRGMNVTKADYRAMDVSSSKRKET